MMNCFSIENVETQHMNLLLDIKKEFFEDNIVSSIEVMIGRYELEQRDPLSNLLILMIKNFIMPCYSEIGVAFMQNEHTIVFPYEAMKKTQLLVVKRHSHFIQEHRLVNFSMQVGGSSRMLTMASNLTNVKIDPARVLFGVRVLLESVLSDDPSASQISNVILQRVVSAVVISSCRVAASKNMWDEYTNVKKNKCKLHPK